MLLHMCRKCYAKIENNSQKNQVVAIVLFRGYTLWLLKFWIGSFSEFVSGTQGYKTNKTGVTSG